MLEFLGLEAALVRGSLLGVRIPPRAAPRGLLVLRLGLAASRSLGSVLLDFSGGVTATRLRLVEPTAVLPHLLLGLVV